MSHILSDLLLQDPSVVPPHLRSINNLQFVPIEQLCFILESKRLCKSVTGENELASMSVETPQERIECEAKERRLGQLADYFVAQLELYTSVCKGRSYNCIARVEDEFSYPMLVNICSNPWLPFTVRSAALNLMLVLHVDKYPQLPLCGRPSMPEHLCKLLFLFSDMPFH